MSERMPPEDDPIIRSIRDAGIRPLPPRGAGPTIPRTPLVLLALALALLFFVPFAAARLADWLWYREIGFERVFFTKIVAQWALGLPTALLALAVIYGSARVALRGTPKLVQTPIGRARNGVDVREVVQTILARGVNWLTLPVAAILAIFVALGAASQWRTILAAANATSFGATDPVFGRDIGYYVFTLPAIELISGLVFGLLMLTLFFVVLPIRMFRGDVERTARGFVVSPSAQRQIATLVGLLLIVTAIRIYFVRVPGLLFGNHLPLTGANYVDLHTRMPALYILAVAALIGAGLIIGAGFRGRFVHVGFRVAIGYLVVSAAGALIPAAYQRLVVQPNELARETPQILHHIRSTRQAWGLDAIEERELGDDTELTPEIIAANRATIDNVRLWDREPLLQTFGQIQSIRTYYDFVAVDDDRYRIGGQLRQVMLSAREMNTASLPTRGFINEHLTYTHGMGVTLGPSNAVTAEGLPVLFIKDLPPASSISSDLRITRPQIYFGELSNDFVLAPSRQREFDYPAGEGDAAAYSSYDGGGGVPIGSFMRRLLYAVRFGSLNILLSADLTDKTRILYHRDVRERAERALPFVLFDRDPYMVITDDGRLVWLIDGYTVSARYPYSRPAPNGVNYMRNSVKVTVDAYHGTVRAYLAAPNDPIIQTLSRIYPGLLQPIDSMPADVRAHARYPEDLFRSQTSLFATYHMANPETFYHREDQWQIPNMPAVGAQSSSDPRAAEAFLRHMVMRLPGEEKPEFILMRPFTPRQKDNLAAWMVARNDGENYGKLAVYRFPRQSLVFGPSQIVNRINQDTEVARQITLWDQRGSEVVRGELLVLPIEGALIYVQPLYLRAQGGRIPELKRVVAAHEGRVSMAGTLDSALAGLFTRTRSPILDDPEPLTVADSTPSTPAPTAATPATSASVAQLTRQAREHYDRARVAQRADDWATYGTEMRRLGEVLRQLETTRPPR